MSRFGVIDYAILIASQVICLAIGVYYGRKGLTKGTLEEFALGNRKMAVIPAAISIFATSCSGHGMTALIGEMYMYGSGFFILNLFYGLGGLIAAYAVVPVFFKIPYISVYEYIEKRYNKTLRIFYVIIYLLQQIVYMSVVMYVPAISLSVITHLPYWTCLTTFSAICIMYSTLGGIKAVIWTDLTQSVLIFTCVILIIVKGTYDAGGIAKVWEIGIMGNRVGNLTFIEDTNNRYSFWAVAFGGLIIGFSMLGTGQAGMQRALSVRGLRQAQMCIAVGSILFILFSLLSTTVAVVIYANYHMCDPILNYKETEVKSEDQIVVYYISTVLSQYTGLAGLATAGIFSGSLSSLSSFINTFATITIHDIIIPNYSGTLGRRTKVILCRGLTVAYGVLCTGFALVIPYVGKATPIVTTAVGIFGGPLVGVFFIGMFVKKANVKGSFIGLTISVILGLWMAIGNKLSNVKTRKLPRSIEGCEVVGNYTQYSIITNNTIDNNSDVFPLYKISFAWYMPIGFITTVLIGVAMSYITDKLSKSHHDVHEDFLSDLFTSKSNQELKNGSHENRVQLNTVLT